MNESEILEAVKKALNISGDYQNDTLQIYVDVTIQFMINAGIPEDKVRSSSCVGILARGVNDLWIYGEGATFSNAFVMLVSQLALKG